MAYASKEKARAYAIAWASKNKDKVAASQKRYYQKNAAKRSAAAKRWHELNPDRVRELAKKSRDKGNRREIAIQRTRAYYKDHGEELKAKLRARRAAYPELFRARDKSRDRDPEKKRAYRRKTFENHRDKMLARSRKHYHENKEYYREHKRKWLLSHPGYIAKYDNIRRARRVLADGAHSAADILAIWERQGHKCAVPNCQHPISDKRGRSRYHVDHITPLKLHGTNWASNLQILCAYHNHSKSAKPLHVWAEFLLREEDSFFGYWLMSSHSTPS